MGIVPGNGEDIDDCHALIMNEFVRNINDMMDEGLIRGSTASIEACSNKSSPCIEAMFTFILESWRPLLLVIDELGMAFTSNSDTSQKQRILERKVFHEFCILVYSILLKLPRRASHAVLL